MSERLETAPEFIHLILRLAADNFKELDGTMTPVLKMVAAADLVFGVWPDPSSPYSADWMIIKGANRVREIVAAGMTAESRITAIPCSCAEQAEALRQHIGADRTH